MFSFYVPNLFMAFLDSVYVRHAFHFFLILRLLMVRIRGVLKFSTFSTLRMRCFLFVVVSRAKRVFVFQCVVYELYC